MKSNDSSIPISGLHDQDCKWLCKVNEEMGAMVCDRKHHCWCDSSPLYLAEHYTGGLPHLLATQDASRASCGRHYGPMTAFNNWKSVSVYQPDGGQDICPKCLVRKLN